MVTKHQCEEVYALAEKKRLNSFYKPSPAEQLAVEAVNNADPLEVIKHVNAMRAIQDKTRLAKRKSEDENIAASMSDSIIAAMQR